MAIRNCKDIVERLMLEHPQEWLQAHRGGPQTEDFIRRLAWVLHSTIDANFGLLGQYGDPNRIADDVIMYLGEGPGIDKGTGKPQSGFDVIVGAGGPDPRPAWNLLPGGGPAIWVKPERVGGDDGGSGPPPPTPPPSTPPELTEVLLMAKTIAADLMELSARVREIDARTRVMESDVAVSAHESYNAAVRASEIKTVLENRPQGEAVRFPTYKGRVFGASVTLNPEP